MPAKRSTRIRSSALGSRTGAALTPEAEREAGRREREHWIRRFIGLFGEPGCLSEYRAGKITFRQLHDAGLRMAELMLAEVQSCHSCAFDDEEAGAGEIDSASEPRHSATDPSSPTVGESAQSNP